MVQEKAPGQTGKKMPALPGRAHGAAEIAGGGDIHVQVEGGGGPLAGFRLAEPAPVIGEGRAQKPAEAGFGVLGRFQADALKSWGHGVLGPGGLWAAGIEGDRGRAQGSAELGEFLLKQE